MKVTRRRDGRFEATRCRNGERKHFIANTEDEVVLKYAQCIMEERSNENPDEGTFKEIREKWFAEKIADLSAASIKMYEKSCFPIIASLDTYKIKNITKEDIINLLKPYKKKTNIASKVYMTLKQIFDYALVEDLIEKSPIKHVKKPKYEVDDSSRKGLTDEESAILQSIVLSKNEEAFIKLCLNFGCRRNEAVAVMAGDVDIENRIIHINRAFDYSSNVPVVKDPKTKAGIRDIPIASKDIPFFESLLSGKEKDDYLITRKNNEPLTDTACKKLWERIRNKMEAEAERQCLKIEINLTPRMLRHQFAINIKSLPIRDQMYLLGHTNYETTAKSYQTITLSDIDYNEYDQLFDNKKIV